MRQRAIVKMKRTKKIFCLILGAMLFTQSLVAVAQQPPKVHRIGYLSSANAANDSSRLNGIRLALRDIGYVEGQNITIEYRYAEGKRERFSELATELVHRKVDIIVAAGGDLLVGAAKSVTKTIPIVMTGTGADPVEAKLVESLSHPGGNVTGVTLLNKDLGGKRLELLKESVPKMARIAILYDPTLPPSMVELKEVLPVTARALGLTLLPWEIRVTSDFERVFAALRRERADGLYVLQGPLVNANQKRLTEFALKNRLPAVFSNREFVDAGGLSTTGRTSPTATSASPTILTEY